MAASRRPGRHDQTADDQLVGLARPGALGPPEHGPDARLELRGRVRLDHVVVGPAVEQAHDLGLVVAGGGHDDRHRRDAAEHPQDVGTVDVGQAEVEHDDVGVPVEGSGEGGRARRLGTHHVPGAHQPVRHRLADAQVVLDHQD